MPSELQRALAALLAAEDDTEKDTPDETSKTADDPLGKITAADEKVRETAKWMATSFAAIGGVLAGGLGLTNLGDLTGDTPDERVAAALIGLALAIIGIATVVWFTSRVLAPFLNSFASADDDPRAVRALDAAEVLGGLTYHELKEAISTADAAVAAAADEGSDEAYERAMKQRAAWEPAKQTALKVVGSNVLARRFAAARVAMVVGVTVAAIGVATFAWGSNTPNNETDAPVALSAAPVQERVHLTSKGIGALADARSCRSANLTALAIGGNQTKREIVTVPTASCRSVRFDLDSTLGTATAAANLPGGSARKPPHTSPPVP